MTNGAPIPDLPYEVITAENVHRLRQIARYGYPRLLDEKPYRLTADGTTLAVGTTLGLEFHDAATQTKIGGLGWSFCAPSIGSLGRMQVVTLTDYGKALVRALGIVPVESNWEKTLRLHQGETQERHAALVLMAAYQARLRGWKAEVMPFDPQATPWFQPDLKLTDPEGWFYYAEVETRSRDNPDKWG